MRGAVLIVAGIVAMSGIVSANLWRELRAERRVSADLRAQLTASKVPSRVATPAGSFVVAEPAIVAAAAVPDGKRDSPPSVVPPRTGPVAGMNQGRDPLMDADYRKARLAEQRMRVQRSLPGLVDELGLSEEEAERFFDLLAENQLNRESASRVSRGADGLPDREGNLRRQQELQRQQDESIAALLGTARYPQWKQYQQTLRARMEAMNMGTQLTQMGQPLNSAQQKSLAAVLIAEDERTRDNRERLARSINPADAQAMAQLEEEAARINEESNRRILEAVGSSLDARQIEMLRKQFEMKAAMDRATSNLQRER